MSEFNRQKARDLIENLRRGGFDARLLFPGPNIGYYIRFNIEPSERPARAQLTDASIRSVTRTRG